MSSDPEAVEHFRREARAALRREGRLSASLRRQLEEQALALGLHPLDRERTLTDVLAERQDELSHPRTPWGAVIGVAALVSIVVGLIVSAVGSVVFPAALREGRAMFESPEASRAATASAPFAPLIEIFTLPPQTPTALSTANAEQKIRARLRQESTGHIAYAPDGSLIAVASSPHISLYEPRNLGLVRRIETDSRWLHSIAFSPDGSLLASASRDTIQLWRVSDGALLQVLRGHVLQVISVAFSPDGSLLASGADDETIRLWRVGDGALLRTLQGHTGGVSSVAFSPDGSLLASGSDDKTVRLWRVGDGALLRMLQGHTSAVSGVAFSPKGGMLAAASGVKVQLWRVSDGALLRTLRGHHETVSGIAFSPDGALLASATTGGTVILWELE